jgi:hypothetical protein
MTSVGMLSELRSHETFGGNFFLQLKTFYMKEDAPKWRFGTAETKAVPQLGRLVTGFPPWRPGFDPRSHVRFVVDDVALG